jgi:Holliday junction resolvasome RuvABC endonuclease subunit
VKILGLDPSLTAYGWAIHDTEAPAGTAERCTERGRFQTSSKMEFIDRYISQRESLRTLIQRTDPDRVGIEFPIFNDMWSEGMYGLFLYSCEALKLEKCDVVFWTNGQVKAHARELIDRPKGWKMDKKDMVEAAKVDCTQRMNHNEADGYHVGRLAGRFWLFHEGLLEEGELSKSESRYFARVHTFVRGKKAGKTVRTGMIYRENERFFAWSDQEETG